MNCEQMDLLLSAWLDGELTAQEEAQMREHLEQCPQCRALMKQLQTLHTSFSDLEELEAPAGFADGVMERIARESKPRVVPLFKRRQFRSLTALAACALLFVGFGRFAMGGSGKSEAAPAPEAATPEAAFFDAAGADGVMEYSAAIEAAPKEVEAPREPMAPAPEAPAAPAAGEPKEAPMETVGDAAPDMDTLHSGQCQIVLSELPEGLEERLGQLAWEERIEDGAQCARLTAHQAELLLEMLEEQGVEALQVYCPDAAEENWILVRLPN